MCACRCECIYPPTYPTPRKSTPVRASPTRRPRSLTHTPTLSPYNEITAVVAFRHPVLSRVALRGLACAGSTTRRTVPCGAGVTASAATVDGGNDGNETLRKTIPVVRKRTDGWSSGSSNETCARHVNVVTVDGACCRLSNDEGGTLTGTRRPVSIH